MGNSWTPEQLSAIEARDTSLIVSAAAGSGKTSVLVERLLRQLSDTACKLPADRLVVVTFTNDAATQMKQRLTEALTRLIENEPQNDWLSRQQTALQTAKISTIHSFCFELIRENIQSLELSAGFRIMDDTEEKIVVSKAIGSVMEMFYRDNSPQIALLVEFFCTKGDKRLEEILLSLYSFLLSIPFYEAWLEEQGGRFFDTDESEFFLIYKDFLREKLIGFGQDALSAKGLAESADAVEAGNLLASEADMFMKFSEIIENSELSWNDRIGMIKPSFDRIKFPKVLKGSPSETTFEQVKKIRNKYKSEVKKLSEEAFFSSEEIAADSTIELEVLSALTAVVKEIFAEVWRVKLEKNAIGFSDAERLAIELLADKQDGEIAQTPLAAELSRYYQVIMIDEFQDANNAQDLIFRLISNGENLFVVGDVKQSIYRFRLANPSIFIDALKRAERLSPKHKSKNSSVILNKNFRSSKDVVGLVNFVFGQLMSERVGEINYTAEESLVQGAVYDNSDRTTEILLIPAAEEVENEADDENDEGEAINLEARAIATKISEMLAGGETVFEAGMSRPCRKSDFCILLRNRSAGDLYVKELEKYGLKAHTDEVAGYLKSREISVLLNLLRIIDNPLLDIAMVSVLMSPMFLFTPDEVSEIRLSLPRGSFYSALCEAAKSENSIGKKAEIFLETLERLRFFASSFSLQKLVRSIYDSTDFLSVVQVYKDGEQKRANLRLLLEYARSYEENIGGGLSGFLRYINAVSEQGGDLRRAGVTSMSEDVIAVKTIHKSKGLEFPFVFLCRTSVKFNRRDLSTPLQLSSDLGIGFMIQERAQLRRYPTLSYIAIREKNRANSISEELRLLYVALTRARERLFISIDTSAVKDKLFSIASDIKQSGGVTPRLCAKANSMQDWILTALLQHSDSAPLRELCGVELAAIPADFPLKYIDFSQNKSAQAEEIAETRAVANNEKLSKLRAEIALSYDNRLAGLPAKLTVSEIAKDGGHELSLSAPKFILGEAKSLTGAAKGVATHTFMQYADFQSVVENGISAERDRLVEFGYLTKLQGKSVDTEKLETFFSSALFSRICHAKNVYRERKFLACISELSLGENLAEYHATDGMLQGIADCIFEEEDGMVLVDYKTDYAKDDNVLRELYAVQLELYRHALNALYEKKIKEVYLYSFHLGREILL